MQRESIEEIVAREFESLGAGMLNSDVKHPGDNDPCGLCKTCVHADKCQLQERQTGTWHCREFE